MSELFGKQRVGIFVVAYNAEATLTAVLDRIPSEVAREVEAVLVCDDASADGTHDAALAYKRTHDQLPMHVVRGADLLSVTPSQVHLQELLGLPAVEHVHVPLVVDENGERLAKRHGGHAWVNLRYCAELGFSGQEMRMALLNSWQQGSNSWGVASNVATWLKSLL